MGIEKFRRKVSAPAISGQANRFTGIANVSSGDASVVVSATQVKSGQSIHTGLGITSVASHRARQTSANSVVSNTSFIIVLDEATVDTQQVVYTIVENI